MSHHHHHHDPATTSRSKLAWAILFNTIITIAEFVGGIMTGYLSLLADAVHNLSDVAALGLAWVGIKGSEAPATKKSTYGYKRVEVMTAFISAAALIVIAVFILREAYDRYQNPQEITQPAIFLSIAVIGLLGNLATIWILHSEKGKSLNMKTAFLHMAYDAISSVAVIIGGIVIMYTGWLMIDTILSTLIALMIFWSSYLVIKEATMIFMESVPPGIDFDEVVSAIEQIDLVRNVHDMHIWSISSSSAALSCHVSVDSLEVTKGPAVVTAINNMLAEKFHIHHGTIQIETEDCENTALLCNPIEDKKTDGDIH